MLASRGRHTYAIRCQGAEARYQAHGVGNVPSKRFRLFLSFFAKDAFALAHLLPFNTLLVTIPHQAPIYCGNHGGL